MQLYARVSRAYKYSERISAECNAQRTYIFLLIWTQKTTRTPRRIAASNFMQVLIIPCTIIFTIRVFIMRNVLYYALGLITSKFRSRIHWRRASGKGAAFFSFTRTGIFSEHFSGATHSAAAVCASVGAIQRTIHY